MLRQAHSKFASQFYFTLLYCILTENISTPDHRGARAREREGERRTKGITARQFKRMSHPIAGHHQANVSPGGNTRLVVTANCSLLRLSRWHFNAAVSQRGS